MCQKPQKNLTYLIVLGFANLDFTKNTAFN